MRRSCAIGVFRLVPALLFLAAIGLEGTAAGSPRYPVKKSASGRYLVDQDEGPYLMIGDSPQALIVNISEADAEMYFANRQARGFNTVWINLLCTTYTGGRPDGSALDGTLPFTSAIPSTGSYDLETPNEAYFAHVDRILGLAADHSIQVLLDPIETGGWVTTMLDNGTSKCRNYGRFLGNRYRDFDNIVWMSGNDFQDWREPSHDAVVREVALGILDNDTRHLHTLELDYLVSSSLDNPAWASIVGLNATYTYYPTYARLRQEFGRPNFLPTFMVEANYEFEALYGPTTTAPILRKQEYWTMTSGATGQLYGNGYTWPFLSGWQGDLDTPGAIQIGYLKALFEPRAWYELIPDTSHVVVTAGYGMYSGSGYVAANDYTTAAGTTDGTLVVVFTPVIRSFTVDMSRLSAAVTARWYDPSNGSYAVVSGSPLPNTGSRVFTPPGNNSDGDGGWVLVLETAAPETQPPTVTLTAPDPGAVVSETFPVSATADDNVAVAGVQFQVDGRNIGGEALSPPYAVSWNTLTESNGSHLLRAIARDPAGNHGADSVSVTVNNAIPPPPADHLAAAYALDEGDGVTVTDASGNGNTAALFGPTFTAGRNGHALAFDGAGDHAEAPNTASLDIGGTGLTISCWVLINSMTGGTDYVIVGKPWNASTMVSPFYQYGLEYSNSYYKTLDFYFGDPSGSFHGPFRLNPRVGAWMHVTYTYDGNTIKGYVDGVERLSVTDVSSLQPRGHSLRLGVDGAYQQFFNGAVDDLRIYSRALTSTEVVSVMQTPVGATTGIGAEGGVVHERLALSAGTRNPFGSTTRISFVVPAAGDVELRIFDVSGRVVRTLESGPLLQGSHSAEWDGAGSDGRPVPSGRYFIHLRAGGSEETISLVLLR